MPYCSNCGHKLTEDCKFCPQCGKKVNHEPEIPVIPEETIPPKKISLPLHKIDKTFTLLDKGDVFNKVYRIEQVIGKENDGISYLAIDESNGNRCSLKLFYQSYFDNVEKLFGAIVRMSKIKGVSHPNIAKVYEVNQTHKPAYIASEYVDGYTLQEVKDKNPELFTEAYVREIAGQLVSAAITIRKAGLAVRNLSLQNIVCDVDGRIIILSTGLNYDVGDEREDIFTMGIVLAKLFSKSAFYETIYVPLRLIEKKFDYINGITLGVNDILAECLHRNLTQRITSFGELLKALNKLKPIEQDEVYTAVDESVIPFKDQNELTMPVRKTDIYFWGIIIFIIVFICVVLMTNLLDTIFSNKKATFKFTGFITGLTDSTDELASLANDSYRDIKSETKTYRRKKFDEPSYQPASNANINPNIAIPEAKPALSTKPDNRDINPLRNQTPAQRKQSVLDNFVYIYGDTYAFGTLRKDARDNVSLNGFYISKNEVTQGRWNQYMRPVACSSTNDNLPVDNVSWFDAVVFCNVRSEADGLTPCYKIVGTGSTRIVSCNFKANGYRLPTEAEWEYAARAKILYLYSGGDNLDQVAWYKDNAESHIHPPKMLAPNAFGLYDMTGNVAEWCWDWYDANYPKTMPFINPIGPDMGTVKVIRGGSIESAKGNTMEVTYRNKAVPSRAYKYVGFRLVRGK